MRHSLLVMRRAQVQRFFPDTELKSETDALAAVIDAMGIDTGARNVLIAHQFVTGASVCDSEEAQVGTADGVDVRVVTPGIPDKKMIYRLTRANYGILLDCGVKIYEYTPGFIHAKSIVSDDDCAVVGTINFDYRSLYLHFENAVYFSGCNAVLDVKRDCEETFLLSKECTRENSKRSVVGKLVDSLLRIFETLF
jgi:phosphatidylserine/phosphatidylglycerophosphate/cardiolipin synthase-like enzyme